MEVILFYESDFFKYWTHNFRNFNQCLSNSGCFEKQVHRATVCISNSVTKQDDISLISLIAVFSPTNILNSRQIYSLMRNIQSITGGIELNYQIDLQIFLINTFSK